MKKQLLIIIFSILITNLSYGQYESEEIQLDTEEYKGDVSVCTNCDNVKLDPSLTYRWLKDGKLGESQGSYEGRLLHGKTEIYNEGFDGKELIFSGSYYAGLKDKKNYNYIFGNLETIDEYDKGALKATDYFSPEKRNEVVDGDTIVKDTSILERRIEYYSNNPEKRKVKYFYYSFLTRVEAEGVQIKKKEDYANFYDGEYKKIEFYTNKEGEIVEEVKEEGTYRMNKKHGEWKRNSIDFIDKKVIRVQQVCEYNNDNLVDETFYSDGKPHTGVVIDALFNNRLRDAVITVKDGKREGNTAHEYNRETKKYDRVLPYANGEIVPDSANVKKYLTSINITKEVKMSWQCDERGGGLYIDKIQYTDEEAIVYFNYYNISTKPMSSVYTMAPDEEGCFTVVDIASRNTFKLKKVYRIPLKPHKDTMTFGEVVSFILVFDKLSPDAKFLSFIEGDPENPYTEDEKGNATYSWGCYEVYID